MTVIASSSTLLSRFEIAHSASDAKMAAVSSDAALRWVPATVPGEVHDALVKCGDLAHPYREENDVDAQWVAERSWWYRNTFEAPMLTDHPSERLRLVFDGLDTVATIWLNGTLLGRHENMFRPAFYDVTTLVLPQNDLLVRLDPPLAGIEPSAESTEAARRVSLGFAAASPQAGVHATRLTSADGEPEQAVATDAMFRDVRMTLRRKPTSSWGWDFAPALPSVGIWRPVSLVRERVAVISSQHLRTTALDLDSATATVMIDVDIDMVGGHEPAGDLSVDVLLMAPSGVTVGSTMVLAPSARRVTAVFNLVDVEFWWTHDLGTPSLYQLDSTLSIIEDGSTAVLDQKNDAVGIRRIELDRSEDPEGGRFFRFVLNGHPIYARGACLVPTTMMHGTTSPARYRELVELAAAGNMNMIRVWGGGLYEDDAFYTAADDLGVLIWQDFLLACMDYPSDDVTLTSEMKLEAEYQVRRLRNHPSLAFWAGNNEVHAMHQLAFGGLEPGNWGYSFFHELLPGIVAELSPEIPFSPGSPWGQNDPTGINGVLDGDRHAWEVWHGFNVGAVSPETYASQGKAMHFDRYKYDTGKFISEFGLQAAPNRATLENWVSQERLELGGPAFNARIKDKPKNKADALLEIETGLPAHLDEYIDFSMAVQAEGLKFGIEHYRRRQPHNSGALVWQLNDPWPGVSWSVLDYDLRPKASYHFVQRAFAPAIASFTMADNGDLELWLTNSALTPLHTVLEMEVATLGGVTIAQASIAASAASGQSVRVWTASAVEIGTGPDRVALVRSVDGAVPDNRWFFAHLKDIPWPETTLKIGFEQTGERECLLTLTSTGYSYLSRIESDNQGARFSNNFIDLRAGASAQIAVTNIDGSPGPEMFTARSYIAQELSVLRAR